MNTKLLLCLFCFLLGAQAFAGDQKGNGGNTIDCGEKSYFFDFYVNKGEYLETDMDEISIVESVLSKMESLNPVRVSIYRERLHDFFNSAQFVKSADLGVIYDRGISFELPKGCKIVQAVIQKLVVFGNEKRYLISDNQWNKLSALHRAGLIMHELFYWELQAKTSLKLGQFNAYLFRNLTQGEFNKVEFYNLMKYTDFEWVYLYGIPMKTSLLSVSADKISSLGTYPDMPFKILNNEVKSVAQIIDSHSTGVPKTVNYKGTVIFKNAEFDFMACSVNKVCKMGLNADGSIRSLDQVSVTDRRTNNTVRVNAVEFDKNGEAHVTP